MCFNVSQCNIIYVVNTDSMNVSDMSHMLNKHSITKIESIKYLGVIIDSNLKWRTLINASGSKVMRTFELL